MTGRPGDPALAQSATDDADLRSRIDKAIAGLFADVFDLLAIGLALERDRTLQDRLRPAGAERFAVKFDHRSVWLEVGGASPCRVLRALPDGMPEGLVSVGSGKDPVLVEAIRTAVKRTGSYTRASDLLAPLFSLSSMTPQRAIEGLLPWSPLLETALYGAAAGLTTIGEGQRRAMLEVTTASGEAGRTHRRRYWAQINLMTRLSLLATQPGASPWLTDMANSFDWITWTPSWPMLRERGLWLTMAAGRVAAGFGPGVKDHLLQILFTRHQPIKTFDAVFGLTALGLAFPDQASEILADLEGALPEMAARATWEEASAVVAVAQAIVMLRDPETAMAEAVAALEPLNGRRGLFTPGIVAVDALAPSREGRYLALTALPVALSAPIQAFFPLTTQSAAGRRLGLTDAETSLLIESAWGPGTGLNPATLH